jgi:hypothetical protein
MGEDEQFQLLQLQMTATLTPQQIKPIRTDEDMNLVLQSNLIT